MNLHNNMTLQCSIKFQDMPLAFDYPYYLYVLRHYIVTDILQVPLLFKNLSFVALIKPQKIEVYFIKAADRTFYSFTGVLTHLGCWENTKFTKSLAAGS